MALKEPKQIGITRPLPSFRGFPRKFSSFLRFQKYRPDEVVVSTVIVALDGTGDYDNIPAAIDSLPDTGGRVIVKAGTYPITTAIVINKSNVTLLGSGVSTIITTASDVAMLTATNVNNIRISDFKLSGVGSGAYSYNIAISLNTVTGAIISNCVIVDMGFSGISLDTCTDVVIRDNHVSACDLQGIVSRNGSNIKVVNNTSKNNKSTGITMYAGIDLIDGNTCILNERQGILVLAVLATVGAKISNNICNENERNGISLVTANNCGVNNNTCLANDSLDTQTYNGINLEDESSNNAITNNTCSNNSNYEINIAEANCENNSIVGNTLTGTEHVGTINDEGTNTQIGHNITS